MDPKVQKMLEQLIGRELTKEETEGVQIAKEEAENLEKQLEVLLRYVDDMPTEAVKAIGVMCSRAVLSKTEAVVEGTEENEEDGTLEKLVIDVVDKAFAKVADGLKELFSGMTLEMKGMAETLKAIQEGSTSSGTEDEDATATEEDMRKILDEEWKKSLGASSEDEDE